MSSEQMPLLAPADGLYWLTADQFAGLAECKVRAARKALFRATQGHAWNGATLAVRKQGRAYLVDARSLPPELYHKFWQANREALTAPSIVPTAKPLQPAREGEGAELLAKQYREAEWKAGIIAPALRFRPRSAGRGEVLRSLAEKTYTRPTDGKPIRFAEDRLREFCRRFEEGGVHALMRKERVTEGGPRRLVNRKWEQACPLAQPEKIRLAEEITRYVRGLWANGAPSRNKVRLMASAKLAELCREAGWTDATIRNCDVGQHLVEMNQDARPVAVHDRDAKRYADHYRPRIARERGDFTPGEAIVGDVHPVDILLARADGSTYTPRMIGWYDLATNRCFYTLLHPAPGKSVTQADVTRSFVDLCMAWGVPRTLYLDNGPEYSWDAMVNGFKALAGMGAELDVRLAEIDALEARWAAEADGAEVLEAEPPRVIDDARALIRAKPYNAAAKPIEGAFSAKEKALSMLPGYIGGNRMNKRVSKVGRAPDPYPGTPEAFDKDFAAAMAFFHATPQRGHLGGMSPDERFNATRDSAKVTRAELPAFLMAFSEEKRLKVRTQGVELGTGGGGKWYMGDALVSLIGTKQTFLIAKWRPEAIVLVQRIGGRWRYTAIHERRVFGFFDPEGAKEASRLNGLAERHIRNLKASADKVDLQEAMHTYVTEARACFGTGAATPTPGPNDRYISLSPELLALGGQLSSENPNPAEQLGAGEFVDGEGEIHRLLAPAGAHQVKRDAPTLPALPEFPYERPAPRSKNPFDNYEEEYDKAKAMQQKGRPGGLGNRPADAIQPLTAARTTNEVVTV